MLEAVGGGDYANDAIAPPEDRREAGGSSSNEAVGVNVEPASGADTVQNQDNTGAEALQMKHLQRQT